MRILWLSNLAPGPVRQALTGEKDGGLWMDHVLEDLRKLPDLQLHLLSAEDRNVEGKLDDRCSYTVFPREKPTVISETQ